ncbi:MAG: MerR family transcriptional regulator [Acidobacteria bacterium]|nr:MAG: MerR family transcriptional regulator [Acidobacteriota bacterium]REK04465.1 MAG: MerR family transcriptional regulator [Acidobacteriota bacterium]
MQALTIGQLAAGADVGVETVRFYERKGLIPEPPRRASGYRQYPPTALERLRFIRRAKVLGFTLDEIRKLLELSTSPASSRDLVRRRAKTKIADIERRVADLERIRRALSALVRDCAEGGDLDPCPILAALGDDEVEASQ